MGENKALKPFLGRPLIERVTERLAPIADEMLVTTNEPAGLSFLGVPLIPDLRPGHGALGGLHTALASAHHDLVAVVACDMPFANATLLGACKGILEAEGADVVIAKTPEGYEPMHALYRRSTCLPPIEAAIEADQWRVISWFPSVRVRILTDEELRRYDPDGIAFLNLNTPEEFQEAERRAASSR
jgi:molybdopterin-guanine dinucleotide biosynthesis protein A